MRLDEEPPELPMQEDPTSQAAEAAVPEEGQVAYGPEPAPEDILPVCGPPPLQQLALPAPPSYSASTSQDNGRNSDNFDENGHRYVGLVNQAMTCYLNSLIQTLYMTPEFRNTIYRVERKSNPRDIAYQLQKLFLLLQTSEKMSLETVDLTASFGWENEVYDQHDVQELCWLMVEALEKRWANTASKGLIENLFKGEVIDYVKCMKCKKIKSRNDMFLDLSLAVRPDGAMESHKSLQEALSAFTKPELLDGNNQYKCENCDSLQDAQKGLGITKFPYLLAVQLKRFSFDYNTMHRIKLNDRLTFPDFLDLNGFLYKPPEPPQPRKSWSSVVKQAPAPMPTVPEGFEKESTEDDWMNVLPDSEQVHKMLQKGPYVYELFSVMVHQGSATGGHYYAYIKNLDQQKWMCFNDSNVNFAANSEVQRTFGGSFSYGGLNNSNAYLLMYRQVDQSRNEHFFKTTELPRHIVDMKLALEAEERHREEQKELEKSMVKVRVVCNDFSCISFDPREVNIHKESSYEELQSKLLALYPTIDPESTRIVVCSSSWSMLKELKPTPEGQKPPLASLTYSRWSYTPPETYLMLDTKEKSHFYEVPDERHSVTAEVWLVDLNIREVVAVKRVAIDTSQTSVDDLRGHLCVIKRVRESNPVELRIVYAPFGDDSNQPLKLLDTKEQPIKSVLNSGRDNPQLFVDVGDPEVLRLDRSKPFKWTEMFRLLDAHMYKMRLILFLPSMNDYCRVGIFPPIMCRNGARSPISSPFAIQRGEGKPFSLSTLNEDTCSSSTPCPSVNDATPEEPSTWEGPSVAVNALNIASPVAPGDGHGTSLTPKPGPAQHAPPQNGSSSSTPLSASSTYSSGAPSGSNNSDDLKQNTEEWLKSSQNYPNHPPPPYQTLQEDDSGESEGASVEPMVIDPVPSYDEVVSFVNGNSSEAEGFLDDDNISLKGNCTPKGSPNVSDSDDQLMPNNQADWELNEPSSSGENFSCEDEERYSVEIKMKRLENNGAQVLELSVDKRLPVLKFQDWVSRFINLPQSQLEFYKYHGEESTGFLVRAGTFDLMKDSMRDLYKVEVRPHVSARDGEQVANIYQYIPGEPNLDKRPILFDLSYSPESEVSHLLLKCQALLKEVYSEEYSLKRLRLRRIFGDRAPLLRNQFSVDTRSDNALYLQVVDDPKSISRLEALSEEEERALIVVMVQRWCPSTFETLNMFEVFLPVSAEKETFERQLKECLAARSGVPLERLELSPPFPAEDSYSRYPFSKPISELVDQVKFSASLEETDYNGRLVYIRDSEEDRRVPSEDEKRVIRNRDHRQIQKETANTFRRMERPLRIQVASISETDP